MNPDILGLHHVTALCTAPVPNLRFYREVLGLRPVKKTVNFDNPHGYHFYFGDRTGRPGTLITFFPHAHWRAGAPGSGEVSRTDFGVPPGALDYWAAHLADAGRKPTRAPTPGGGDRLSFSDPDGTRLSLIENALPEIEAQPPASEVPRKRAITGIASVAMTVSQMAETSGFLVNSLGFTSLGRVGPSAWFRPGTQAAGQQLEVIEDPNAPPAVLGSGSVHHVAWRVGDAAAQMRLRSIIAARGLHPTEVRDRNYFQSVYFREPGGVIFEIATDSPGFLVDEDEASLGEALKLPHQFEPRRAEIEAALPNLKE